MPHVTLAPRGTRSRVALLLAVALAVAAPARASAQSVAVSCARADAEGCAALRFSLLAGGAPWLLQSFAVQLGEGWTFRTVDGDAARTPVWARDSYSFEPIAGSALRLDARDARADFGVAPGFTFDLEPDAAGYLEFAVSGTGAFDVAYAVADLDGVVAEGSAAVTMTTTPEPTTAALTAAGGVLLALAARRRRTRVGGR